MAAMKRGPMLIWGHWIALMLCIFCGVGLVWLAPETSEITIAMVALLSSSAATILRNLGTIVDHLYGSSADADERKQENPHG